MKGIINLLKEKSQFLFVIAMLAFTSCGLDKYNAVTEKTEDVRKNDEYVYGDGEGKPARQIKNTYPDTPEGAKRADALRAKMFGSGTTVLQETSPTTTDSTQVVAKKDTLVKAKADKKVQKTL